MSAARITVSSVALGPEADATLLRNIATWGGGRNYVVSDARQIPEIFVKEAKGAATPGSDDDGTIAVVMRQPALFGGTSTVPGLRGRNVVTRKPQAIDLLATDRGDPLLTTWPVGLGRTAMLAVDVEGRWTRDWLKWRGFGSFLTTVVRVLSPRRPSATSLEVTSGEGRRTARALTLSLEARDAAGQRQNLLAPKIRVTGEGDVRGSVPLAQVAPGRYEARVVADTTRPLRFAVETTTGTGASPHSRLGLGCGIPAG